MSLDVSLYIDTPIPVKGTGVFIRDNGRQRELSPAEVAARWPGAEVAEQEYETNEVFQWNITHNLNRMAEEAGLYVCLWKPEGMGLEYARALIPWLQKGLANLKAEPDRYRQFNPENKWGSYEGLVEFVEAYLKACEANPDAKVRASR